jgi:hypothetical protein
MAKLNKGQASVGFSKMYSAAENLLATNETELRDGKAVGNVIGLESHMDGVSMTHRANLEEKLGDQLAQAIAAESHVELTEAQKQAGAIIAMAKGDLVGYAHAAMRTDFPALESGDVDGPAILAGAHGLSDQGAESIALEYFTEQALDKHLAASFTFNVQAARQDNFAETIMPTVVADPTDAGLLMEINKSMVHRAVRHAVRSKDSVPFQRRNILDAVSDHTVLEDRSIDIVPYMLEDGDNAENFVDASLVTPHHVMVGDYSVRTNPLAFSGKKKNMLELSAHPKLVTSGVLDESDEINGRVELAKLYFTVKKKGAADTTRQVLVMNTANLPRSTFNKSQEGDGMGMELSFSGAAFLVSGDSTDRAGQPVTAFDELKSAGYQLRFTIDVHNKLNLQTGVESSMHSPVEYLELSNEDGDRIDHTKGAGKTVVDALEIVPVGYEYKMTRDNSNRRTKGLLLDGVVERERYKIQLGSPITSRKPIGREDKGAAIERLITASRIRTSSQCITKILNVTDVLEEVVKGITKENEYDVLPIEGVGRHYVRPWFDRFEFDVANLVSTKDSQDVDENLAATIVGLIREQVVRAMQESRFQPALEMLSGYTMTKPKVIIATDIVIANWIDRKSNRPTLGDQFEYEIVTTADNRWKGRIQWFFNVSDGTNGINPLNFGNHIWVPELITDTNLTRNEGTANEITVQTRNTHVVHCPITGVIIPRGLREFIQSRPVQGMVFTGELAGGTGSGDDLVIGDLVP